MPCPPSGSRRSAGLPRGRSSTRSPRRWRGIATTPGGGRRSSPRRSGSMPTEVVRSPIEGVRIWRPQVHGDDRGRFVEVFRAAALPEPMAQSNHSRSARGVLRGLHYHRNQADLWYLVAGRAQVSLTDLQTSEGVPVTHSFMLEWVTGTPSPTRRSAK